MSALEAAILAVLDEHDYCGPEAACFCNLRWQMSMNEHAIHVAEAIARNVRRRRGVRTWQTAPELMATVFAPADELIRILELIDSGECSPTCILGTEGSDCQCRCEGQWHGFARVAAPVKADDRG